MKAAKFYTKLSYQQPMLRQIEWGIQNGSISKNETLTRTSSLFKKFN